MKAPLVEAARQYLEPIIHPFHVHVGPVTGWRTVSKLAVRPATDTTTDGGGDNGVTVRLRFEVKASEARFKCFSRVESDK